MKLYNRIEQYIFISIYILLALELALIQAELNQDELCKKLLKTPNFNVDRVLGEPWKFYYTWPNNMGDKCIEMTFVKATQKTIDKIGEHMIDYMDDNIEWQKATILISLVIKGGQPREVLLIPVVENPGGFRGIPYLVNNVEFELDKRSVMTSNLMFKILRQGKFLVMADCNLGLAALMARVNQTIFKSEILATSAEVWEEDGYLSCVEKNENEIEGTLLDLKNIPEEKSE